MAKIHCLEEGSNRSKGGYSEKQSEHSEHHRTTEASPEFSEASEPTSSTLLLRHDNKIKENAIEELKAVRWRLSITQDELDHWPHEYREYMARYNHGRETGQPVVDVETWDLAMLQQQKMRIAELIKVERMVEDAENVVRSLGINPNDLEAGSDCGDAYQSRDPDSYIDNVDRFKIFEWLEAQSKPGSPEPVDMDDWEFDSVGMGDSISNVAYSFERKIIDQWQRQQQGWSLQHAASAKESLGASNVKSISLHTTFVLT